MVDHIIRLSNTSGVLQYVITDYLSLSYVKQVNAPGMAQFAIPGDHPAVATITDKWQVQIRRRDQRNGLDWTTEFDGYYREPEQIDAGPAGMFIATAVGIMSVLGHRIIAYAAGTANRTKFVSAKAETVMKTLVSYNAGSNATTGNGRIRTGTITDLNIEADGANGNTINYYCAYDNLLETLQKIAMVAGGDFDLVKTGATSVNFNWYTGQRGTDRTATVTFAVELGNMANPYMKTARLKEKTVAIVAGQDQAADRDIVVRTGANYNVTTNNIETFIDARDITKGDTTGLNTRGDQNLIEVEAVNEFEFDVIQVENTIYGLHYFLGDLVTAINPFTGTSYTRKVNAITVVVKPGSQEVIKVGLGNE